MVLKIMVHAKIGMRESRVLVCSTWATVQSLHGLSFGLFGALMKALSRNLKIGRK
jgi:hypothetical protein